MDQKLKKDIKNIPNPLFWPFLTKNALSLVSPLSSIKLEGQTIAQILSCKMF